LAASILIIIVSAALLIYWFRYTCLLILRTPTGKDYATGFAAANHLSYAEVRQQANEGVLGGSLAALEASLERDYRMLTYLLRSTVGVQVAGLTVEQRMLMFDFRVMQVFATFARRFGLQQAQTAVLEMTDVLQHLANDLGERAAASSKA
jgi:hypothetical protein